MEKELSNETSVVGNYGNIPTSITSQVLVVTMVSGLSVVKTADKDVWANGELTYTIKVSNQTTEVYSNPIITDVLDTALVNFVSDSVTIDGVKAQSSQYSFNTDTSTLTVNLSDIDPSSSTTVTFKVSKID